MSSSTDDNHHTLPPPPPPDPHVDAVGYLRSLVAVRERCGLVMNKARSNQLIHFEVDMTKFDQTVKWVLGIIKVRFENFFTYLIL
jgi:hypothetical protein